jgi:ligand-binding SRPBCC domain-containing protein
LANAICLGGLCERRNVRGKNPKMSNTIKVATSLNAPVEKVWAHLSELKTLQYVARPLVYFKPKGEFSQFYEGESYNLTLKIFGLFPIRNHHIFIKELNKANLTIKSQESNAIIPVWNHTILLKPNGDKTDYTDEIEINADKMTKIVSAFAKIFYKHRQKRWKKLLKSHFVFLGNI